MAQHNLEWGATQDAWIFSILLATQVLEKAFHAMHTLSTGKMCVPSPFQPDIKKVVDLFRPQPEDDLHKRTKTGDFGFSVERLQYGQWSGC